MDGTLRVYRENEAWEDRISLLGFLGLAILMGMGLRMIAMAVAVGKPPNSSVERDDKWCLALVMTWLFGDWYARDPFGGVRGNFYSKTWEIQHVIRYSNSATWAILISKSQCQFLTLWVCHTLSKRPNQILSNYPKFLLAQPLGDVSV